MAENKHRWKIQLGATLASNPFLMNFLHGRISRTGLKAVCVPGLNCYSCPAAAASCPIGALQAVIGSSKFQFAWYVVGFLIFAGALLGRGVCGFLCPFGWFQELLHKIPAKKFSTRRVRILTYLKYGILALFVIVLPMTVVNEVGMGDPFFCKYICPAGILEGGIPLALADAGVPGRPGRTIYLEELHPAGDSSAGGVFLPAFLQVAVPAGGLLRAVQQNFHLPPAGGLGPVHRLRGVQSCVQNGCGCVQDAQPC